jgi:hypothetical protein
MADNKNQFRCTGDCTQCIPVQRQYCAAQKGYDNQRLLMDLQEAVSTLTETVGGLNVKLAAIQDNEAFVFNPEEKEKSEIPINPKAQEGDGAKE